MDTHERFQVALDMIVNAYKQEYGEETTMENGEVIAGVFNDCVVIIEKKEKEMKINVSVGEPYKFDIDIFKGGEIDDEK